MAQQPASVVDPLLGKVLADRFEILERIGEGGMGVVYRARQLSVDRVVAIKVLTQQLAQDPTWTQRFMNEARACSKLQHPNTIRLIDFGQAQGGLLFMAMEFLDGVSLRQALDRSGPMPAPRVLKILIQTCQSLAEAHALGIIHRDLKPDNLFLVNMAGNPDFLKVLDFSVAKLRQQAGSAQQTQAGVVFGTPQYMSPEQGRGLPLDARSDIYAIGVVAYEMLMGRAPFNSQNPMEVLAMHVRTAPPPLLGVPEKIAQVVLKSLAKEPGQRQQTVEQFMQDCQAALGEFGSPSAMQPAVSAPPSQAKTMFADAGAQVQAAVAAARAQGGGAPAMPPQGPEAKTMIAGQAPPEVQAVIDAARAQAAARAQGQGMPGGTPAGGDGVPVKTVALQPSEGVVSFAREGKAMPGAVAAEAGGGPGVGFWLFCIVFGLGLGAGAYFLIATISAR